MDFLWYLLFKQPVDKCLFHNVWIILIFTNNCSADKMFFQSIQKPHKTVLKVVCG